MADLKSSVQSQACMSAAFHSTVPQFSWSEAATAPVFTNSGAERFTSELQAADQAARQLYKRQLEISDRARTMAVTPPGMLSDVAATANRVQTLSIHVRELEQIPVDLRTEQTNNDLELLRGKLGQIKEIQSNISQAMTNMDLSGVNNGYQQLNSLLDSAERGIRDQINAQEEFNQSSGSTIERIGELGEKLKSVAANMIGAFSMKDVLAFADSVTQTTIRLAQVNDGLQSTDELNQMILESAKRSRTPYMETARAVTEMGMSAGNAFSSNDEMIAFIEQVNKQFAIGGASAQEQSNAMALLTQAMASGSIRGEELNSILAAAPGIAQAIEQSMGWAQGSMMQYAENGQITASVVKNSLLGMAQSTDEQFHTIPVTFGQLLSNLQNTVLQTLWPVIQLIAQGASFLSDHWSAIAPVFFGAAAAVLFLAAAWGIHTAAMWLSQAAASGLFMTLLASPLTWITLLIGFLVMKLYEWVQSVGGAKIAWMLFVNGVVSLMDRLKLGFMAAGNSIRNVLDSLQYKLVYFKISILNILQNLKIKGLSILQSFVNGAVDMANGLIKAVNAILGTSFHTILYEADFTSEAIIERNAKQKGWTEELAAIQEQNAADKKRRAQELYWNNYTAAQDRAKRNTEVEAAKADLAAKASEEDGMLGVYEPYVVENMGTIAGSTGNTASNTAAMAEQMDIMDEDLKYMRDAAEQEIINRFTLAELKIDVNNNNTLKSQMDFDDLNQRLARVTGEILTAAAEGGHL